MIAPFPGREPRKVSLAALRRNAILDAILGEPEIDLILENGMLVELEQGQQIYSAGNVIDHLFFPIDCVFSVVIDLRNGSRFEVGSCGREGFSAVSLLFGASKSANAYYCPIRGTAIKVGVALFQSLIGNRYIRQTFDRYAQAYVHTMGELAACSGLHNAWERFSRWLLITHDRVNSPFIPIACKHLAMILGTTHSETTVIVEALQKAGLVSYADGILTVRNRASLELVACNCYSVIRAV